jgi:hypothetical protein
MSVRACRYAISSSYTHVGSAYPPPHTHTHFLPPCPNLEARATAYLT